MHEFMGNLVDNGSVPSTDSRELCSSNSKTTMEQVVASTLHNSLHRDSESSASSGDNEYSSEHTLRDTSSADKAVRRQE